MSFDPTFVFYRDGDPGSFETLADMAAEAEAELATRQRRYPGLVSKGRLTRAEADRELRVMAAIADEISAGGSPQRDGENEVTYVHRLTLERAARRDRASRGTATWTERVHALRREIALRRQIWPGLIAAGRIDGDEADRRLRTIESLHAMTWECDWSNEAIAGRSETERRAAA